MMQIRSRASKPASSVASAPADADAVQALGIAQDVVHWHRQHGRHDLPWQANANPYLVWLSEVMLQQTQVATVIPYFERFVCAFPTVDALAAAPLDRVMSLWSGLGYYSRARNLHAAARLVVDRGGFPESAAELAGLPGVGRSTAAAIAVFGFNQRAAILEGNVKRLFCRVFAIEGHPGEPVVMRRLWAHAQAELPAVDAAPSDIKAYTQGLMDLGATLCTRSNPACNRCPLQTRCLALRGDAVARYPTPRPRRQAPVREVDMVLLCNGDAILIEQRPPVGIWGGLWSLPQTCVGEGEAPLRVAGLVLSRGRPAQFMRFEHAFTHFRMRARVWKADLDTAEAENVLRQSTAARWLPLAQAGTAPLPGPIKSLLLAIGNDGRFF